MAMLHLTTEIGKPGKKEYEKRHYPGLHNRPLPLPIYKPRGRRYIPHGYGFDEDWRPHPQNIQVEYSECGPDWKSQLKYLPHPENPEYPAAEIWPNNWYSMRPFPHTYRTTSNEWLFDPGHKVGLRCVWEGVHKATNISGEGELPHTVLKGRSPVLMDRRNGIPSASPGDKSYQAVEYSPSFHKLGSSLPLVNFGAKNRQKHTDTFIPLQPLPPVPRVAYREVEKKRQKEEDVKLVKNLNEWKPATPLLSVLQTQDDKKER